MFSQSCPQEIEDTVVALQALALFSAKTAGNSLDLKVKLTIGDMNPPETRAVHITPENALLRTKFDVRIYFTISDIIFVTM